MNFKRVSVLLIVLAMVMSLSFQLAFAESFLNMNDTTRLVADDDDDDDDDYDDYDDDDDDYDDDDYDDDDYDDDDDDYDDDNDYYDDDNDYYDDDDDYYDDDDDDSTDKNKDKDKDKDKEKNENANERATYKKRDYNYNPTILAQQFVEEIDHPYFLEKGTKAYYESQTEDGLETIVIEVMDSKKVIMGIECTIVRDVEYLDGVIQEDTYDYFAQDNQGNVWYMGEFVTNYENGVIEDHEGSFEAGVDNALPGLYLFAEPVLELPYRMEYYVGEAEDWGKVIALDQSVTTSYGVFDNTLKVMEWNSLEGMEIEYKYFAEGIGMVKEMDTESGEIVELVDIVKE